jgi:hypothetical protein
VSNLKNGRAFEEHKENPSLKIWMDSSLSCMVVLLNGIENSGPVSVGTYFGKGSQYYHGTIDAVNGNGSHFQFLSNLYPDREESHP